MQARGFRSGSIPFGDCERAAGDKEIPLLCMLLQTCSKSAQGYSGLKVTVVACLQGLPCKQLLKTVSVESELTETVSWPETCSLPKYKCCKSGSVRKNEVHVQVLVGEVASRKPFDMHLAVMW